MSVRWWPPPRRAFARQANFLDVIGPRDQRHVDGLREIRSGDEEDIFVPPRKPVDAGEHCIGGTVHVNRIGLQAELLPIDTKRL